MPQAVMEDERDFSPAPVTPLPFTDPLETLEQVSPAGTLGTREEIEKELDFIAAAIRIFYRKQPDQVMRECAGYSARLTELCVLLHRVESTNRQYTRLRTQQVQRFLEELERQFKVASRLVEVMRQDIEVSR